MDFSSSAWNLFFFEDANAEPLIDVKLETNEPCSDGKGLYINSLTQFDIVFSQPDTCNSTYEGIKQDIYYTETGFKQS